MLSKLMVTRNFRSPLLDEDTCRSPSKRIWLYIQKMNSNTELFGEQGLVSVILLIYIILAARMALKD